MTAGYVEDNIPRALINREKVSGGGGFTGFIAGTGMGGSFNFGRSNYRSARFQHTFVLWRNVTVSIGRSNYFSEYLNTPM